MVIRFFSIIAAILFSITSCEKKRAELSMIKSPYTGSELKTNGYFYSSASTANDINIAVLYRNGVCIFMSAHMETHDTLTFIENEILLNEALMSRLWNTPTQIGVFKLNTTSIEFETWIAGRDITTFSYFGEIRNDTSFSITRWVNNCKEESHSVNWIFRFQQFSPKPDSTNTFIK